MKCSEYQLENREEIKFCKGCNALMEFVCSQWGTADEPDRKFCDQRAFKFDQDMVTEKQASKSEGESTDFLFLQT